MVMRLFLASTTHVAGIDISAPVDHAIFGSNLTGINLNRNVINSAGISGIELNYSGTASGSSVILDNAVTGPSGGASILVLTSDTSNATSIISRNTVSNNRFGVGLAYLDTSTG